MGVWWAGGVGKERGYFFVLSDGEVAALCAGLGVEPQRKAG